jgi:ABC-type Fe3+/spermidine/putrescine transport system ATPase subunit
MGATLTIDGVTKRFGATIALDAVSLEVKAGEFFTLLGPSGCGKTTLLRAVAGFVRPDGGRILCGGARLDTEPAHARDVGLVFQNYAIFPHLSVFENIAYGLRARRVPTAELGARTREALAMVRLDGLAARMPAQLSGGQQQRVALARALVVRPRLLLMDEPLSNLDAKLRLEMRTEIRRLQRALQITTLYVTHDQEEALAVSERLAVMSNGRIEQIGPPWEIYAHPQTAFVARFVGASNTLEGTVVEEAAGSIVIAVAGGRMVATRPPGSSGGVGPGQGVVAIVRPEAVAIASALTPEGLGGLLDEGAGRNAVEGVVESREYLGAVLRYAVRVGAGMVMAADVHKPDAGALRQEGERVRLIFSSADVLVYPAERSR